MESPSKRASIIKQAMNRLKSCQKSFERPVVTCGLLVSPVGKDVDWPFEWPVVDRWIAEVYSNDLVTVKVIVEADGDIGREQYENVRSTVADYADLLNVGDGVDSTHFLIEKVFANKKEKELAVAKLQAQEDSVVSEVIGPTFFPHLRKAFTEAVSLNASGETTPTFQSARLHKTFFLECWEQGLRETCTESQMRSFITRQWNKKFGRKTDSSGNFLFKAPANAKNARLGYIRALKRPE